MSPAGKTLPRASRPFRPYSRRGDSRGSQGICNYYDYDDIDGREYITMGPAGASWHHDGPGNVDHLTWVTVTENGPEIGNIALKGIFDRKGLDPSLFGAYDRKGAQTNEPKSKQD